MEDHELLREYAERRTEVAFAELVSRHINLVYSTALRMVGEPQFAQDVAQTVFIELARNPKFIREPRALAGWLYRSTRFAAASALRTEQRRRQRENVAMEMNVAESNLETAWQSLAPHIEEAMATLDAAAQNAVVLRFFENKSLREVGAALGMSDDAAQKRVSRALEKLRSQFARHGITTTVGALSVTISANAVQAAPAGLAATICAGAALAGTTIATTVTATATKAIAMTTIQKTIVTATVAVLAGVGIYEAQQAADARVRVRALQQQQAPIAEQIEQLTRERDEATKRLTKHDLRLPPPPAQAGTHSGPAEMSATNLLARSMEKRLSLTPEQTENFLTENHRSAGSLLAAFRTTSNAAYLDEAMQRFPDDPQVAFEVALKPNASQEEKRRWLDALKKSAPDNSLANYFSALAYFNSGQADQAVQELVAASGKSWFTDYSVDRLQANEEAYRSAGYPEAEGRLAAVNGLDLPQLYSFRDLNNSMMDLAKSYRQAGDETSAQVVLGMMVSMGERFDGSKGATGLPAATRIVALDIERRALEAMDPASPVGSNGGTAKDQLDRVVRERAALAALCKQFDTLLQKASAQDLISYVNRGQRFGEEAALQWLKEKYGEY